MNAEHKRPLFAFLIVTVVAAVVFANGLQRQVVDVIRNGASTVVAGTSLLHDPLYVVEEGARIATQDKTSSAAEDPAGQAGTPLPGITEDEPDEPTGPVIAPGPEESGASGSTRSGGGAAPGGTAAQGGNGTPGGDAAGGGQGRPRAGDDGAGNQGPGGGGPGPSQPDQAEGHGEKPERPEAHGHGRSDDRARRGHDDSGPGKSDDHRSRGHGQGSGHDRDDHKAQRHGHGEGHAQREHRGEAKGHAERDHGRR